MYCYYIYANGARSAPEGVIDRVMSFFLSVYRSVPPYLLAAVHTQRSWFHTRYS